MASRRSRLLSLFSLLFLLSFSPSLVSAQNLPAGATITEDKPGQVTIKGDLTANSTLGPQVPITATIFSGSPGPKACRGSAILHLALPPAAAPPGEAAAGLPTPESCYNLPQAASCGNFVASKEAGCQARLFAEPGCRVYVNTAVFVPEPRAVGGVWRSVGLKCGVPAPDPKSLGQPPLAGMMQVKKRPGKGAV